VKQFLLATVVGGIVYFLWTAVSWMALPLHDATMHDIPNEPAVLDALQASIDGKGVYFFPAFPEPAQDASVTEQQREAWADKHRAGPVGLLVINPGGAEPMPPTTFLRGLLIDFLMAAVVAATLVYTRPSRYVYRVAVPIAFGLFAALAGPITLNNWMHYPIDYALAGALDPVIGWTLAGLAMAAIVKPPPPSTTDT